MAMAHASQGWELQEGLKEGKWLWPRHSQGYRKALLLASNCKIVFILQSLPYRYGYLEVIVPGCNLC